MSEPPKVTILHIDDNEASRYVVKRMLVNAGFNVVEAATGEAGLQMAAQQPNLIILDVQLPDIGGFEVCRRIKSSPATASIPVLHLSSSFVKSEDKAQGLEGGADGYLVQPVESIELIATVKALLRMTQLFVREQEARAAAEAASRLKDEFLATLSHELRSPLNAMLGWTQLLRSHKLDQTTTDRAMEVIERNAKAQAQLIEDLLDVSHIIQGKLRLNVCPVELTLVIQAAIDTVSPAAIAKEIRLQTVLDSRAGVVAGDFSRLQQVVWNLLSNAVKFTPKGGRVQVRLERINSHVEIVVADTGRGISSDFIPYVFDRFRQADSSITRSYGGLGIGLALVRHLTELHGGTVRVHSQGEGQGATFTISLPLIPVRIENHPERVHPAVEQGVQLEPPSLQGVRVLVVDDEADAREFVIALLEQCGADVIAVASASEAIATVSQSQLDVLVSDIGMPDEDGYSLIRKIRVLTAAAGGQIPAVALTAYARAEDRTRAIAAGFQMHLSKPVEPAELATVVASLAKRSHI